MRTWYCGLAAICGLFFCTGLVSSQSECKTKDCRSAAKDMLSAMDTTVDPCDDFYKYSCGNWDDQHPIPKHSLSTDAIDVLGNKAMESLRIDLEVKNSPKDIEAIKKIRNFYKSCMNTGYLEKNAVKELRTLARAKYGGWPMINQPVSPKFKKIDDVMAAMVKMSVGAVITVQVINFSGTIYLVVRPGSLGLGSPEYYSDAYKRLGPYEILIRDTARLLGGNKNVPRDAYNIVKLETTLAKFIGKTKNDPFGGSPEYIFTTVDYLSKSVNKDFDWLTFFEKVTEDVDYEISSSTFLYILNEDYVRKALDHVLSIDPMILRNFLVWRGIQVFAGFAGSRLEELNRMFKQRVYQKKFGKEETWQKCAYMADAFFSDVAGRLFVKRSYDEKITEVVDNMFNRTGEVFRDELMNSTWMDDETKETAVKKQEKLSWNIGYDSWIMNDALLNGVYASIEVDSKNLLKNYVFLRERYSGLNLRLLERTPDAGQRKNRNRERKGGKVDVDVPPDPLDMKGPRSYLHNPWRELHERMDEMQWNLGAAQPNAYIRYDLLYMFMTAAILQKPAFSIEYPVYMNYGTIGFIIAHEMGHAHGIRGFEFDDFGENNQRNFTKITWKKYLQKGKCYINQYNRYSFAGIQMDGAKALVENSADNIAIKFFYQTYMEMKSQMEEPPATLPGVELNDEQILFVRMAQMWCENRHKNSLHHFVTNVPYSTNRFRVYGSVRNSEDFARVFQCPVGSNMNPEEKCSFY